MPPATSESLIAAALGAATITYEQSLLYRTLALYDSPGLPEEFRSPIADMDAATALFDEVDQNESQLSKGLLDQLAPYRVRPADPISIFNNPTKRGSLGVVLAVATAPPAWVSQLVAGTNARVWVPASVVDTAELATYGAAVAKAWAGLKGVFTYPNPDQKDTPSSEVNPDTAIDFYFVDTSVLDPREPYCVNHPEYVGCSVGTNYGYASRAAPYAGTSASGYLVLKAVADANDPNLLDTLAHELTHAGQYAYDQDESSWLKESTATWAAFRVMQKLNLEPEYAHNRLPPFFAGLDKPLPRPTAADPVHRYASWLFFLFASMEEGDAIVTTIWQAAAAPGVQGEKAIDQVFPFDKHFGAFGVRNWNQDPVTPQYKDVDASFPGGLRPTIAGGKILIGGAGEVLLDTSVLPLSTIYHEYQFQDAVRRVTLDNRLVGVPGAHVWAIKKIGDAWAKPEDWSSDAKEDFCRNVTDQDLTDLVIIVSNSGLAKTLSAPEKPRVVTKTTDCVGWVGTVRGTYVQKGDKQGIGRELRETSVAQVQFIPNPYYGLGSTVEFVLGSATVTWTYDQTWPAAQGCNVSDHGSFSIAWDPDVDPPAGKQGPKGKLEFLHTSGGPAPSSGASVFAGLQFTVTTNYPDVIPVPNCPGVLPNPTGATEPHVPWYVWPEDHAAASADGMTLTGSNTHITQGGDFTYTYTWELHYIAEK